MYYFKQDLKIVPLLKPSSKYSLNNEYNLTFFKYCTIRLFTVCDFPGVI